ncbi:MAG: hypothetical protein QOF38_5134 [Pseudonocardiales bacterium]|nr:hypothetical protein [Pseudonocardiales bacterium]MDT7660419.1 hypothetical protein [Pseudonocardiales bacterium]MDT7753977.1 hypothetical protein [Pseudonocardiales bacterium]
MRGLVDKLDLHVSVVFVNSSVAGYVQLSKSMLSTVDQQKAL